MLKKLTITALVILIGLFTPALCSADDDKIDLSFSGRYRIRSFSLRNGSNRRLLDPNTLISLNQTGSSNFDERQNYFDTRLRLSFKAARGNNLSLNTQFEIGDITFGGAGGGLGTDGVNIETKHVFLEWTPGDYPLTFRGGLYSEDTSKSIILSEDVAGFRTVYSPFDGNLSLSLDYLKAVDNSRIDLDNDGITDNDFNDRDIWIFKADYNQFRPFTFGGYFVAEIDNSNDTPVAANTERDVYWMGGNVKGQTGILAFDIDGIFAFGDVRNGTNPGSARIEAWLVDARFTLNLPVVGFEFIAAWATGDDPSTTSNEAFPVISSFYAFSNIIFDDFGGFNVTGSNVSGIGHLSLIATTTPYTNLELQGIVTYAVYTGDPRRPTNVNRRNLRSRELGWEVDLNATYTVNENLSFVLKTGVFFPQTGFLTTFDSRGDDPLIEVILGAKFRF
ncbi:MAG: alginate export family protein [Planctomycetota bacterium]|nr:alginate export family protein [Planctomycetota bacterium]